MINIRLGNHHKIEEKIIELIDAIKRHSGCCDEVWFASEYGFPKLEVHKASAENIAKLAECFKNEGITVSLQISNTIGHGEYMKSRLCDGLVYDGSPAEKMVGSDGAVADYCFCWNGENFRKYTVEVMKLYSSIKPDTFWIDDDLRPYNHAPVNYGCYCDNCISKFNKLNGCKYDREELVREICYGDTKVRQQYIDFIKDGLYDFTKLICEALIKDSPDSSIGFQSVRMNNYTGLEQDYILKAMKEVSGKNPKYRAGGGFYNDKTPLDMLEKAMMIDCAISTMPAYVKDILPEIENTPDVAFGKSIGGTVKEATLYLANGCTETSFASLMTEYEPVSWHENMFEEFVKVKPYWEKLSEISKMSKACGVGIYESSNSYLKKLTSSHTPFNWAKLYYMHGSTLQKIGIPITNVQDNAKVYLVTVDMLEYMSNDEILSLTKLPVITDARVVEEMKHRGIDVGISVKRIPSGNYYESLDSVECKRWVESFFISKGLPNYIICGENIMPIGTLYQNLTNEKIGCCNAIVTFENAKWAVFGYGLWNDIISTDKRQQILDAIDTISDRALPAYLKSGEQVAVFPRVNSDGKTISLSLQSISIGRTQELEVVFRNPVGDSFFYMGEDYEKTPVSAVKNGNDFIIRLPKLNGWSMITVFCE